jgi:hypothetical protein
VDGPVHLAEQLGDGRPVVEVDHGRRGAAGRDEVHVRAVADQRGHLMAVFSQFGQYVRSDEPGPTGKRYFHGRSLLPFKDWTCDHAKLMLTTSTVTGHHRIPVIRLGRGAGENADDPPSRATKSYWSCMEMKLVQPWSSAVYCISENCQVYLLEAPMQGSLPTRTSSPALT